MAFGLERNVFHRWAAVGRSDAGQLPGIETPLIKENRVPARRKSMRKTKEVLRLRFELGLGQRQIARSCGMGLGTVHQYLERAAATGIIPSLPDIADWEAYEAARQRLIPNLSLSAPAARYRVTKESHELQNS